MEGNGPLGEAKTSGISLVATHLDNLNGQVLTRTHHYGKVMY
jgi:hypothetical protein